MKKPTGRPKLGKGGKLATVRFRCSELERSAMERAAAREGLGLSKWARRELNRAARNGGNGSAPGNHAAPKRGL